jgi:hypothetical protein
VKLTFVQLQSFVDDAERLGLDDEDLQALEQLLLENPERGALMAGTGGVRKVRFAPPSWNVGKSGATRVVYAHLARVAHVYFLMMFEKADQANLTPEQKQSCRAIMLELKAALED